MRNNIKNNKGFTIIEVMIVLAIAGLIMLIVFLAVPALQRNSRNTQYKNDAQAVAAGISEFMGVNNGKLPTAVAGTGDITVGGTTETQTKTKVNGATDVSVATALPTATSLAGGKVQVYLKKTCANAANTRAVSVWYLTEASTDQASCLDV